MDYLLVNSECSSGCESGWTLYLDDSFVSPYASCKENGFVGGRCDFGEVKSMREAEEEEDLSMVSDASSGPPHFAEEEDYANDNNSCFYHATIDAALPTNTTAKMKKMKENQRRNVHHEQASLLDDTASSPVVNHSNNKFAITNHPSSAENVLDFSHEGSSTTHFEERSAYQDQYGFFNSSLSGNYLQENQWVQGRRWQ